MFWVEKLLLQASSLCLQNLVANTNIRITWKLKLKFKLTLHWDKCAPQLKCFIIIVSEGCSANISLCGPPLGGNIYITIIYFKLSSYEYTKKIWSTITERINGIVMSGNWIFQVNQTHVHSKAIIAINSWREVSCLFEFQFKRLIPH